MESTDTPKVSVILRGQNDWRAWYDNIKTTAKSRQIWHLIDPTLTAPPLEPSPPVEPGFHLVKSGIRSVTEFSSEDYDVWKRLTKEFDRKSAQYEKNLRNLNAIKTLIRSSIARYYYYYIYEKPNIFEEIKTLYNRFSTSDIERQKELRKRYFELQKIFKSTDIDI